MAMQIGGTAQLKTGTGTGVKAKLARERNKIAINIPLPPALQHDSQQISALLDQRAMKSLWFLWSILGTKQGPTS